jgi:hypothetical protein
MRGAQTLSAQNRKSTATTACAGGGKRFGNHRVLVLGDVAPARLAEIEHEGRIRLGGRVAEIARHEPAKVFGKGDTEIAGPLAGAALHLGLKRDLRSCHHDITIIASAVSRQTRAAGAGGSVTET